MSALINQLNISNLHVSDLEAILYGFLNSLSIKDKNGAELSPRQPSTQITYRFSKRSTDTLPFRAIEESLRHNGMAVVEGFLDEALTERANMKIEAFLTKIRDDLKTETFVEKDKFLVQNGSYDDKPLKTYQDLASHHRPVVHVRNGLGAGLEDDKGMIDIFHVNRLNHFLEKTFSSLKDPFLLEAIGNGINTPMSAYNLNAYINKDVTRTRGFHLDNVEPTAKAFVYLTDVNCLEDGPFCYALGSHADLRLRAINSMISKAYGLRPFDITVLDRAKIVPVLAPKGSLIISYQFGAHRGAAQSEGHSRTAIVQTYARKMAG